MQRQKDGSFTSFFSIKSELTGRHRIVFNQTNRLQMFSSQYRQTNRVTNSLEFFIENNNHTSFDPELLSLLREKQNLRHL